MDWSVFIERVGVPIAILFAIGMFIYFKAWPFLTQQIISFNKERTDERKNQIKEREDFISALHQITHERSVENTRIQEFLSLVEREREGNTKISQSVENLAIHIREMDESKRIRDEKIAEILTDLTVSVRQLSEQISAQTKTKRKTRNADK